MAVLDDPHLSCPAVSQILIDTTLSSTLAWTLLKSTPTKGREKGRGGERRGGEGRGREGEGRGWERRGGEERERRGGEKRERRGGEGKGGERKDNFILNCISVIICNMHCTYSLGKTQDMYHCTYGSLVSILLCKKLPPHHTDEAHKLEVRSPPSHCNICTYIRSVCILTATVRMCLCMCVCVCARTCVCLCVCVY